MAQGLVPLRFESAAIGIFGRREIAERSMRPNVVVIV
jgi:hypothetical protein